MKDEDRLRHLSQEINELRQFWKIRVDRDLSYLLLEDVFLGQPFSPRTVDILIFLPPFYPLLFPSRFALPEEVRKGDKQISDHQPLQGWVIVQLPLAGEQAHLGSLKDFLRQAFVYLDRI